MMESSSCFKCLSQLDYITVYIVKQMCLVIIIPLDYVVHFPNIKIHLFLTTKQLGFINLSALQFVFREKVDKSYFDCFSLLHYHRNIF